MKHVFIVNVNANNGKIKEKLKNIRSVCESLKIDWALYPTKSKEETKQVVESFKDQYCTIYAIGGDGTVNTVLNSIVGGNAFLGIIPFGTGNDFYRSLSEKREMISECNVMKVNDLYCLNIFSVGLDAEICHNVSKLQKLNFPDGMLYPLSMVYTFFKHKNEPMLVQTDNGNYYDFMTLIAVCNGKYYGHGVNIAPCADITSAFVPTYMVADMKKWEMPIFLKEIVRGDHASNRHVEVVNSKKFIITAENPMIGNVDGEIIQSDQFEIDTSAAKIKVVNNERIIELLRTKK